MNFIFEIFGHGKDLTTLQMSARAILIFFIALIFIRLPGRRSFGIQMPFDIVVSILLGSTLSRVITGDSPFVSSMVAASCIVIIHRLCGWLAFHYDWFGKLVKGNSEIIYSKGKFLKKQMRKNHISEKDLMSGVRLNANVNSLDKVKEIFVERNGEISAVKEEKC